MNIPNKSSSSTPLNVIQVPAFHDNYLWIIHLQDDKRAYVVDPGDAKAIEDALKEHDLILAGILVTHHHPDHTAGIAELLKSDLAENDHIPVYGPAGGSVPTVTHPQKDGDSVSLANGQFTLQVFEVPGHTLDHIAYFYMPAINTEIPALFSGDTLFAGGCGRLFEGTAVQMHDSLSKYLQLPDNTRVYCAHEYTLANLAFAIAVEPNNDELTARIVREKAKRERNQSTVPTTLGLEKATNPFLRCHTPSVIHNAEAHTGKILKDSAEVFGAVRKWKDNF